MNLLKMTWFMQGNKANNTEKFERKKNNIFTPKVIGIEAFKKCFFFPFFFALSGNNKNETSVMSSTGSKLELNC